MSTSGGVLSAILIHVQNMLEDLIAHTWNRLTIPKANVPPDGLLVGSAVEDGKLSHSIYIANDKRTEHIAVGGKTGQGKSFLIRNFLRQDVERERGFLLGDLHGDLTPFALQLIAARERRTGKDLSSRLIVVDPADPSYCVGLNVLEGGHANPFVQTAEFTQILKKRWHLESFGARTEELLRNSLHALADNNLTLVELGPLLSNDAFRSACMTRVSNADVAEYFRLRFGAASEAMQAVMREPILNKVSAFTADPHFRHILGQQRSTFSLAEAMDRGAWVILQLNKGQLGENAVTLAALLILKLKNALFSRRSRSLFTWYLDEVQNLVAIDSDLDTVLSEARKFGISVVFANQFLAQLPPSMQAAAAAVGTHIYFQLSSGDADKAASALDGGKRFSSVLKNLPKRHVVIKSGSDHWTEVQVSRVPSIDTDASDLLARVRARWSVPRQQVEQEITARISAFRTPQSQATTAEELNDWE
jgi:DNA helicase HerA-like ATPase